MSAEADLYPRPLSPEEPVGAAVKRQGAGVKLKETFLAGTYLFGCYDYRSPYGKDNHCPTRCGLALLLPCVSLGRTYTLMRGGRKAGGICGLSPFGCMCCCAHCPLMPMLGAGLCYPVKLSLDIKKKYKTLPPDLSETCLKSVLCMPCFLVQLHNYVELCDWNLRREAKQAGNGTQLQPTPQINMV